MDLAGLLAGSSAVDLRVSMLSVLIAFTLSHVVAASYTWTHRGLSYSSSFVHALIMGGVVASMLMLAIGNNLVWGIGIVGTLAIIRFRTNLRDPRDMVYVFAALASGIAAGVQAYSVGITGTAAFLFISLYLRYVSFGARNHFDGLLRFVLTDGGKEGETVNAILRRHCSRAVLSSLQQVGQDGANEHAYQVRFRNDRARTRLMNELRSVRDLDNLSLLMQDSHVDL